jgi:TRAP transporter TAXI family solute receptor
MNLRVLRETHPRFLLLVVLPALLLIVVAFWIAAQFVKPAPPKSFVMTTGPDSGAYHTYAKRYQDIFARYGVRLELRPSSGSVENLARLRDDASDVSAGFVQGGTGNRAQYPDLESLGAVYFEPLWLFYRGTDTIERLIDLKGRRVAVGPEGSGTRPLVLSMLAANGITAANTSLLALTGDQAAQALRGDEIDAMLMVSGVDSSLVRDLLSAPGVRLGSVARASAYVERFPFLNRVVLPAGGVDLERDIPKTDTVMVAPTANIVVRDELHPALLDVFMIAMKEVHGDAGYFHGAGEFPSAKSQEFPLSKQAERFYRSGPPFLLRYLPFWAATLVDRLWVILVPIVALVYPLVRVLPPLYSWRMRRRIYRWYGELKFLEEDFRIHCDQERFEHYMERLQKIEEEVMGRWVPLAFSEELYILREHINLVRGRLHQVRHAEAPSDGLSEGSPSEWTRKP